MALFDFLKKKKQENPIEGLSNMRTDIDNNFFFDQQGQQMQYPNFYDQSNIQYQQFSYPNTYNQSNNQFQDMNMFPQQQNTLFSYNQPQQSIQTSPSFGTQQQIQENKEETEVINKKMKEIEDIVSKLKEEKKTKGKKEKKEEKEEIKEVKTEEKDKDKELEKELEYIEKQLKEIDEELAKLI